MLSDAVPACIMSELHECAIQGPRHEAEHTTADEARMLVPHPPLCTGP